MAFLEECDSLNAKGSYCFYCMENLKLVKTMGEVRKAVILGKHEYGLAIDYSYLQILASKMRSAFEFSLPFNGCRFPE
jgi:hypothetical protein